MKKSLNVFLIICLFIPVMMMNNPEQLAAKRYRSSMARSRNSSSLKSFNQKNNYSTTANKQSSSNRRFGYGSLFGSLMLGSLLFGNNVFLSTLTTIFFWGLIIMLIMRLLQPRKTQSNYQTTNHESHQMQQMRYINQLVENASRKDIDVSYILDDQTLTIDEKIILIKEKLNVKL